MDYWISLKLSSRPVNWEVESSLLTYYFTPQRLSIAKKGLNLKEEKKLQRQRRKITDWSVIRTRALSD